MGMIKNFWGYSSGRNAETIWLGRSYTRTNQRSYTQDRYESTKPGWQMFWRKRMRKDKKVSSPGGVTFEGAYDPETYKQNFDQGTGWMEPDNLPRSFSAKYANTSGILRHDRLLDDQFQTMNSKDKQYSYLGMAAMAFSLSRNLQKNKT